MTFIYSSELLLKIRQIYLDDTPLYIPPPPPSSPAPQVKKTFKKKPNRISNQPKEEKSDSSRIVEKRKSAQDENGNAAGDESTVVPDVETTTQVDRSRKISNPPRSGQPARRPNQNGVDRGSTSRTTRPTVPKQTTNNNRRPSNKQMPPPDDDNSSESSESKSLASKPLIWILILFANTLLVFAFIILLAICYYRSKLN